MGIKMTDTETKKFKIDLSAPLSDELPADAPIPTLPRGVDAGRRPMLLILIGIVVMGAAFVWGYYDLRKILHAVGKSGSMEITVLAEHVTETLAEVSKQLADQKTVFQTDMSRMEDQLKTIETAAADLQTRKADQSDLKTTTGRITAAADALKKDIDNLRQRIDLLSSQTETAISDISKAQSAIGNNLQQIEKRAASSVDKDMLDAALTSEREIIQQNMAHASETLFSSIASLQQAVKDLHVRVDEVTRSAAAKPAPEKQEKPGTPGKPAGSIMEQEIK